VNQFSSRELIHRFFVAMPYLSKRQARWANATRQPFAKRWNKLTSFTALPEKKESGATGLAIPPTGSNALFNQMGIANRRRKRKRKECTCTTKAAGAPGELLEPGVRRIRGNLCNVHGRYGPCDDKGGAAKNPKGGSAKKPAKVAQTPEQRAQAREQERTANADAVAKRMRDSDTGLSPAGVASMRGLAQGQQPDKVRGDGLVQMGLAELASDGTYRMSATGRAAMNAMASGDYQRTVDTISRATDSASARRGRQETATTRRQEVATRRAATQAKREQATRDREAARAKRQAEAAKKPGSRSRSATAKPEQTAKPKPTKAPARRRAQRSSSPSAPALSSSPKPKPKAPAPEKLAKPAKARIAPALSDAARALSEGDDVTDKQVQALITNGLVKLNKDGQPVLTAAGQRATMKESAGVFAVFKSADGVDRWLAITTTAYEDKDREIISTKAIARAVELGDKTGERGPLRYWHVPGLDIGDCDYQAQGGPGGRFLIEGGTFRSKAMAELGATLSSQGYQMSPGFIHTADQPSNGVYDSILIFERSAVPPNRAANHFTRLRTKEEKVLTEEKAAEYREKAAGNTEALAMLEKLLASTAKEDATAQDQKVAYKDAPEWAQLLITRIDGLEERFKAFPPAAAEAVEEEVADDVEDEMVAEEPADDGGMDDAAFAQMLAQSVVQAITPLLDIEKKMAGHMADLKSTMGGFVQRKDDASAAQAAQIAALDAKLKELTGDLPSSVLAGAGKIYRPSESALNLLTTESEAKVKELNGQVPAGLSDAAEIGAYQLIFGNQ
jgi:hypothetical protein